VTLCLPGWLLAKSCRHQRQIKKEKEENWHGTEACWRWRHLRRITTSMTALLNVVLSPGRRVASHCIPSLNVTPRRVVLPPHRTFEVWAKWHAVYCWRVLELRSARTYQLICGARNYHAKLEHRTRPSLYTASKYLHLFPVF